MWKGKNSAFPSINAMLKYFLAFLFFIQTALANVPSSYYLYESKPIRVNNASFSRYVIPQLRAMSQEYYHLLRKLHPMNNSIIQIKTKIISMNVDYQIYLENCRNNTVECLEIVKKLYQQARELDALILKLKSKQLKLEAQQDVDIAPLIKLTKAVDEISGHVYRLMHKLEQLQITLNTDYFEFRNSGYDMNQTFYHMDLASENILTSLLSKELQDDFNFARSTFFKNIELYVVQNKNKEHLISQLERLNMSWNTFNMRMTKGNHQPSREVKNLIKIMHNRWNSVLKIVLRD